MLVLLEVEDILLDKKRRRGRSPTTGQYVGMAEAKENLLALRHEELDLMEEKILLSFNHKPPSTRAREQLPREEELAEQICDLSSFELEKRARKSLQVVDNMSDSKSLNVSYKHALRVEALNARVAAAKLGWKSLPKYNPGNCGRLSLGSANV